MKCFGLQAKSLDLKMNNQRKDDEKESFRR